MQSVSSMTPLDQRSLMCTQHQSRRRHFFFPFKRKEKPAQSFCVFQNGYGKTMRKQRNHTARKSIRAHCVEVDEPLAITVTHHYDSSEWGVEVDEPFAIRLSGVRWKEREATPMLGHQNSFFCPESQHRFRPLIRIELHRVELRRIL